MNNFIHISKTYTWNPLLKQFMPNPGETYVCPKRQGKKEVMRKYGLTGKQVRTSVKKARRANG